MKEVDLISIVEISEEEYHRPLKSFMFSKQGSMENVIDQKKE